MKRPRGVTIIGVLLLLQGLFQLLVAGGAAGLLIEHVAGTLPAELVPSSTTLSGRSLINLGVLGVLAVLALVGGFAMLRLRPWAWLVAMLLQGVTLATNLFYYFVQGQLFALALLLAIIIVFYLNSRTIRHVFEAAEHRAAIATTDPTTGSDAALRRPSALARQAHAQQAAEGSGDGVTAHD